MSKKSKTWVMTVKTEDPASNSGIIAIYKVIISKYNENKLITIAKKDCVPYLPMINGRHQKTIMHGDQGFFERGNPFCRVGLKSR